MAVNPEDLVAGTLAFQTFAANAKYVEMIVDVAFAVVPTILGIGAAGLIGSSAIRTAKDVMGSISVLRSIGPGIGYGGLMAGKGLNRGRILVGERAKQSDNAFWQGVGHFLTLDQLIKSKWTKRKQKNQDTQGKQEEQGSGGSGGTPPPPPDIKSDKKEEKEEIKNVPIHPSYDFPNPFKKKK